MNMPTIHPAEHPLVVRLRNTGLRLRDVLLRRERTILFLCISAFTVVFSALGAWKLWSFGYNALDLAIYRQVAECSIHGHIFSFTIHPHSYLGDHFELFFVLLLPLYKIFSSPFTLIVLQSSALAIAAIPLARCAQRFLPKPWHLIFPLVYLANPMVQNMSLFEFHVLPFAIPVLSLTLMAYLERRYALFLISCLVAVTIREDVSLAIVGFGVLALLDRRSLRWILAPIALGAAWFFVAMKLTALYSGYGHYKFFIYYGWLGHTPSEILQSITLKPWLFLSRLFQPANLAFLAGFFLPFAYLPLFRPRWLIPTIPILLQLLLVQSPGDLLLQIHYTAIVIPFMIVGAAATFSAIYHRPKRGILRLPGKEFSMTTILLVTTVLYSTVVIGPLVQAIPVIAGSSKIAERIRLERSFVQETPSGGTVAGFETITAFSQRPRLYSLHYVFLGKKQFSDERYVVPSDAQNLLLDLRDALLYQQLYRIKDTGNRQGYERIRTFLAERNFSLVSYIGRFALFERNVQPQAQPLYTTQDSSQTQKILSQHGDIAFNGWSTSSSSLQMHQVQFSGNTYATLPITLTFEKTASSEKIYQLEFRLLENDKVRAKELLPFGGGVYPTCDWALTRPVSSRYELLIPRHLSGKTLTLEVRVIDAYGDAPLNGLRSIMLRYSTYTTLGPALTIGQVEPVTR